MKRVFKITIYEVLRPNVPLECRFITVVTDRGQRAKPPEKGAKRIECFYGVSSDSRQDMIKRGYIVQSKTA